MYNYHYHFYLPPLVLKAMHLPFAGIRFARAGNGMVAPQAWDWQYVEDKPTEFSSISITPASTRLATLCSHKIIDKRLARDMKSFPYNCTPHSQSKHIISSFIESDHNKRVCVHTCLLNAHIVAS